MPEQGEQDAALQGSTCTCPRPIPVERATRKGAVRTECARCSQPIPLRLG